jgi:Gas vesicle protein
VTIMQSGGSRGPSPSGLADVIETILDKGLVIDAYVRVSPVGIEVLTIAARVVIASVDTYLRFSSIPANPGKPTRHVTRTNRRRPTRTRCSTTNRMRPTRMNPLPTASGGRPGAGTRP